MQVALFTVAPGDNRALEEFNRFLRGHRVLTLDRHCFDGVWSFCVVYQPPVGSEPSVVAVGKIDYKEVLDEKTFALFSRLRDLRKGLAEQDSLPHYAVFTNEHPSVSKRPASKRCSTGGLFRAELPPQDIGLWPRAHPERQHFPKRSHGHCQNIGNDPVQ